jgi:hypothetical protein
MQMAYTEYLGTQEAGKELLLYGIGNNALAPLKKQYINFCNATIHSIVQHLCEKMAIKMTTSQKFKYKAERYGKLWGIQQQASQPTSPASTSFEPPLLTAAS